MRIMVHLASPAQSKNHHWAVLRVAQFLLRLGRSFEDLELARWTWSSMGRSQKLLEKSTHKSTNKSTSIDSCQFRHWSSGSQTSRHSSMLISKVGRWSKPNRPNSNGALFGWHSIVEANHWVEITRRGSWNRHERDQKLAIQSLKV